MTVPIGKERPRPQPRKPRCERPGCTEPAQSHIGLTALCTSHILELRGDR